MSACVHIGNTTKHVTYTPVFNSIIYVMISCALIYSYCVDLIGLLTAIRINSVEACGIHV